jgi:hypothetical protein
MGSLSAAASLQLRIELHGIQLGRPTDLLIDVDTWQVLGFVVYCGDESVRFLPYAAAQHTQTEIAVGSALMLLEDVGFYQKRAVSFRSLLGGELARKGTLRDVYIGAGGAVSELEVERDGVSRRLPAAGQTPAPAKLSAA